MLQRSEVGAAEPILAFSEPIRLIIWDLDETYWNGTLTEGGISYVKYNHDLVIELARRGIISSICSKNDPARVESLLRDHGIWDYFVFPSISWEPKGQRVARIVETIQLRPESVLFIDDNFMNLEEARFASPKLNVSAPDILPLILTLPEFKGKEDSSFSRLKQYRLLEKKQSVLKESGGDNLEFLRNSQIKVLIDYDVESKLDRAVELINRTNQLNFTKNRLPEDEEQGRFQLISELRKNTAHAGIVNAKDRFGNYGDIGFFLYDRNRGMRHFCFSCRCLNMHIERAVFQRLGRPRFKVVGEVLSDIFAGAPEIDWITFEDSDRSSAAGDEAADLGARYEAIYARGGCDIASLTHYFSGHARELLHEANFQRSGIAIRIDHSQMLTAALDGLSDAQMKAAARIGYRAEDFATRIKSAQNNVAILSFWADADIPVYRHKATGLELPFWLIGAQGRDLIADKSTDSTIATTPEASAALQVLRSEFEHIGLLSDERTARNYRRIAEALPSSTRAFVLLANEYGRAGGDGHRYRHPPHTRLNNVLRRLAKPNTEIIDTSTFVDEADLHDLNHFDRMVYFRLFKHIISKMPKPRELNADAVKARALEGEQGKLEGRVTMQEKQGALDPGKVRALQGGVRSVLTALQTQIVAYSAATGLGGGFLVDGPKPVPRQELLEGAQLLSSRVELLKRLPTGGRVAEIGTLRGEFAAHILKICRPSELHLFDVTFSRLSQASKTAFSAHGKVSQHEGRSWDGLAEFADHYFDWVYIDGDHSYDGVLRDIQQALRTVKPGGMIICNDYMNWSPIQMMPYGVLAAVNDAINQNNLQVVFLALESRGYYDIALRLPKDAQSFKSKLMRSLSREG